MLKQSATPLDALLIALPETAGSALYGMFDVLAAAGNLWHQLVGSEPPKQLIETRIISNSSDGFTCGNGIPVQPHCSISEDPRPNIIVIPELWLGPDEDLRGRHVEVVDWIRRSYERGVHIYSACSGSILLAETALLNGREATSHWGYERLFRQSYPEVQFKAEPVVQFADPEGRIVTAGGTTSWHDLAIHIIARHCSPREALRIAQVYLLKTHDEGQLPYTPLVRTAPHADSGVRQCEELLREIFKEPTVVSRAVNLSKIPERSLKRRFKMATGLSIMDYVQNLRIEAAKRLLESSDLTVDEISAAVGYENPSFFRRLFSRRCGLNPAVYRRMFSMT